VRTASVNRARAGESAYVTQRCSGFTYIGLLFFIALMGAALVAVAQVWHIQVKRDKEAQLLFVGNQFRRAISLYYERAPGGLRQYPKQLDDLLQDPRYPNVQRHLRKLYIDPMTGKAEWGLVRTPDGSILGIYSLSEDTPLKTAGFSGPDAGFADAVTYREWKFAYLPADARGAGAATRRDAPGRAGSGADTRARNGGASARVSRPARACSRSLRADRWGEQRLHQHRVAPL
jgi:type II secretory pathway pseudopilin PulG